MPSRQSPGKPWQRSQKGQVLLIFALTALVVFAIMGLAIDAGISYLHSDQQARAASAAALSGVSYLPGDFPNAQHEALLTAQRNGYTTNSLTGTSAVTVAVSQPANTTNELKVAITAPAPVYFLDLFGFGRHLVTSSAIAEYLPPIQLGQPGNTLGSSEPAILNQTGEYFLRTEGYGNPRSEGDAFTPTPTQNVNSCGGVCTATTPDVHQVSCIAGNDTCSTSYAGLEVNDTGGYNYLIFVPKGQSANVQVDSPSFQPGNDTDSDIQSYHDDDSSFPTLSSGLEPPATDYASMGFTLYAVPDVNNRAADIPLKQDIFCPFNAYGLETGLGTYTYYQKCNQPSSTAPASPTKVTGTPTVFQNPTSGGAPNLVSLLSYAPSGANANLFHASYTNMSGAPGYVTSVGGINYLYGGSSGSGQYFRLRVDTLAWNGSPINTSTSAPSPSVDSNSTPPDGYPYAHDAYSLAVVTPGTTGGACVASCTVSAMADMCIYTPIQGSSFQVPLFNLPAEYAGKIIAVRVFDPGDVGGGAAYLGIVQPGYTGTTGTVHGTGYATLATNTDLNPASDNLGVSLAAYEAGSASETDIPPSDGPSPSYPFSAGSAGVGASAVVQTAGGGGGSLFNGQWVQFDIKVPPDYNPDPASTTASYWNLFYHVAAGTTAGDTITVQVQYLGSPVHLLP